MKLLNILLGLILVCSKSWCANPWGPSIVFGGRSVTVSPAKLHLNPYKSKLEIVESEGCEAKLQSSSSIQFSESCDFLRGVYQYSFRQPGSEKALRLFSEFSIHQSDLKSRVFVVESPIVIHEDNLVDD